MSCVETVSYSVLMNGKPYGMIRPHQGLRQGDILFEIPTCSRGAYEISKSVTSKMTMPSYVSQGPPVMVDGSVPSGNGEYRCVITIYTPFLYSLILNSVFGVLFSILCVLLKL